MTLIQKCRIIADVIKKYGSPLTPPDSFGYWHAELRRHKNRYFIYLPWVLNVSFGARSVKFQVGDEHVLNFLFERLYRMVDK